MWWRSVNKPKISEKSTGSTPEALAMLDFNLEQLNQDKYLYWHAPPLRLVSVFDELKYDRSDLDMLSFRMRQHVISALKNVGCFQKSGHLILQQDTGTRFIMPKFVALGASPFAATRYHKRNENDYWVFTPTQAACFMIENLPFAEALSHIESLLHRQPINLYRILDFIERKESHQSYRKSLGHLVHLQRQAIESQPLRYMKHL